MTALRLLAVLAHPDDETLGFGGILAKYAAEGVETFLVTATRGERGRYFGQRPGEGHPGPEPLGQLREAELRAAASVLGVRAVSLLGYGDQEVDRVDSRAAVKRLVDEIRRLRPHVVVTFGPDGGYGHPDHIAISQFATAAAVAAADPRFSADGEQGPAHAVSKLYYLAWPESVWSAYERAFHRLAAVVDGIERRAVAWPDWAITTVVDTGSARPAIWRAAECHASQVAGYEALKQLPAAERAALWSRQHFYRAYSLANGGRRPETDLFEGLRPTAP